VIAEPTHVDVKFPAHSPLRAELNRRVEEYFETSGRPKSGGARMVTKSVLVLAWLAASYVLLVFFAANWWQVGLCAVSLSLAVAGVGFNIQHDGGHDAYSGRRGGNKLSALSLDLIGGSSFVWRFKHAVLHHHFTNIDGVDEDVDSAPFLRLAPTQKRRWWHRLQHWYAWVLFGFLPPKWAFFDDFVAVARGRVGRQTMPKPRKRDVALMIAGKLVFFSWVFAVPLLVGHSVGGVLGVYAFCALVTGICLAVVFQLAHCVEEADFPVAPASGEHSSLPWVEHQLATTVDFAPRNPFLTWYLGGLNFQVEHHLFPRISHVHYPKIAPIVDATCREFGVRHRVHQGFWPAFASHVRHLRRLGRGDPRPAAAMA
jgi:linoleoyl-CoA desaturase